MACFDEKFQAGIVDEEVGEDDSDVADKLRTAFELRLVEADVACEPEAREGGDWENDEESGDVRSDGDDNKVENVTCGGNVNGVVENEIQQPVKHHIGTA